MKSKLRKMMLVVCASVGCMFMTMGASSPSQVIEQPQITIKREEAPTTTTEEEESSSTIGDEINSLEDKITDLTNKLEESEASQWLKNAVGFGLGSLISMVFALILFFAKLSANKLANKQLKESSTKIETSNEATINLIKSYQNENANLLQQVNTSQKTIVEMQTKVDVMQNSLNTYLAHNDSAVKSGDAEKVIKESEDVIKK